MMIETVPVLVEPRDPLQAARCRPVTGNRLAAQRQARRRQRAARGKRHATSGFARHGIALSQV
jgi:hypothetical protein